MENYDKRHKMKMISCYPRDVGLIRNNFFLGLFSFILWWKSYLQLDKKIKSDAPAKLIAYTTNSILHRNESRQ